MAPPHHPHRRGPPRLLGSPRLPHARRPLDGGALRLTPDDDTLVAIGANLPGADGAAPLATCRRAAAALDALLPGLRLIALSRWWATEPDPPDPHSPWYVNGVARLRGPADPAALLAALQSLEAWEGRERPYPNAPRTLDLDIVAMGRRIRDAPDPIVPHPRAHLRRFVLQPLAEVWPRWRHPARGESAEALLGALPPAPMRPLA